MREEVKKLYLAGVSIKGIAAKVGISEANVGNYLTQLRKAGEIGSRIDNRITPEEREERDKKIIHLYKTGRTEAEICRILNVGSKRKTWDSVVRQVVNNAAKKGLLTKRTKEVCRYTPGRQCLRCPFKDCVRSAVKCAGDISKEEKDMLEESGAFKKEVPIILNDEYTHKRRYINGYRDY